MTFHHILDIPICDATNSFIDNSSTKAFTISAAQAEYATVEGHPSSNTYTIMETNSFPPTTTSQKAELYAVTRGLQRAKDKTVNIQIQNTHTVSSILIARYGKNRAS
jgi:ribonuclease HI